MNIHIKQGRVIDPAQQVDAVQDIFIAAGKIITQGEKPDGFVADTEIAARGLVVCPGFIDLQAHLCEPGLEHKATIASETAAAAKGGITTLCCPPDTQPVIDHPAIAEFIQHRAERAGKTRVIPLGALTQGLQGEHLSEMAALQAAGCQAVSNARKPIINTRILRHCFEYAATLGLKVFIHPEDPWLAQEGCVHEGIMSTRLGLAGIPATAETIAISRALFLIAQTGVAAHFGQLSCGDSVELITQAQERGLPVSADVAAHQLHLTELDVGEFNTACHVSPPLRTLRDHELLRLGVKRGIIQAICSDHQPHEADAKLLPFAVAAPGISGLETLLPLTLRLVNDGVLTLPQAIATLTQHPAAILGIQAGTLSVEQAADICIFDPEHYWTVSHSSLISKGHNTPFAGWELRGQVKHTLLEGIFTYSGSHS